MMAGTAAPNCVPLLLVVAFVAAVVVCLLVSAPYYKPELFSRTQTCGTENTSTSASLALPATSNLFSSSLAAVSAPRFRLLHNAIPTLRISLRAKTCLIASRR